MSALKLENQQFDEVVQHFNFLAIEADAPVQAIENTETRYMVTYWIAHTLSPNKVALSLTQDFEHIRPSLPNSHVLTYIPSIVATVADYTTRALAQGNVAGQFKALDYRIDEPTPIIDIHFLGSRATKGAFDRSHRLLSPYIENLQHVFEGGDIREAISIAFKLYQPSLSDFPAY